MCLLFQADDDSEGNISDDGTNYIIHQDYNKVVIILILHNHNKDYDNLYSSHHLSLSSVEFSVVFALILL